MTGILHFLKVHVRPVGFYQRLVLAPVFANGKKSKEDFHVCENSCYCINVRLSNFLKVGFTLHFVPFPSEKGFIAMPTFKEWEKPYLV